MRVTAENVCVRYSVYNGWSLFLAVRSLVPAATELMAAAPPTQLASSVDNYER